MRRPFRRSPRRVSQVFLFVGVAATLFLWYYAMVWNHSEHGTAALESVGREYPTMRVEDNAGDLQRLHNIREVIRAILQRNGPSKTENNLLASNLSWKACWENKSFLYVYTQEECMWMWFWHLRRSGVLAIDQLSGITSTRAMNSAVDGSDVSSTAEVPVVEGKPFSNGGMRTKLADVSAKGYWKPCLESHTGNHENYFAEIISFLIDRSLGFAHTPAVAPRYFRSDWLEELVRMSSSGRSASKQERWHRQMQEIIGYCSSAGEGNNDVEGAFVGWSPFPLRNLYGERTEEEFICFWEVETEAEWQKWKSSPLFQVNASSPPKERAPALEVITIQLFALLTGNMGKFDHNLFQSYHGTENGPFIYIDNDRAQWEVSTRRSRALTQFNPFTDLCKFPAHIAHRILLLRPGASKVTLGRYIWDVANKVMQPRMRNPTLFTTNQAMVLDENVEFIAQMIESCLARFPPSDVLIPEPWPQPHVWNTEELLEAVLQGTE